MPKQEVVTCSVERVEVLGPRGEVDEGLMPDLSGDQIMELYETMVLTRVFDERMFKLQRQGRMGTFARVLGQEGAHIGAAYALRAEDWMVPAFRETGAFLLKGVPMEGLLQYWSGDERGNLIPESIRMLPTAIPVGTHMLHAVGIGWAMRHRGEDSAVLTSFGEGATSEGDFSEAMNFAAVFGAPVVFLCQNNKWAISVPYSRQTASVTVAQKAVGYGMPGIQVDGNDVFAVYRVTREALERARSGGGPTLIEADTYRMADHTTSDDARRYRSQDEVAEWRELDPVLRLSLYMKKEGLLSDEREAEVESECLQRVADAVEAFESIEPAPPEEIFAHVFAEPTAPLREQQEQLGERLGGEG